MVNDEKTHRIYTRVLFTKDWGTCLPACLPQKNSEEQRKKIVTDQGRDKVLYCTGEKAHELERNGSGPLVQANGTEWAVTLPPEKAT